MTRHTKVTILFVGWNLGLVLCVGVVMWGISSGRENHRKEIQSHAYVIYPLTKYGRCECEAYASDQAPTVGENGVWVVVDLQGRTHWHSPSSVEIVKNKVE